MAARSKYSTEVRERAVRMVLEQRGRYSSQWEAIRSIAGKRDGITSDERTRLKEMEREIFELWRANEILRKASAYFAQAELDRRAK
jgi:transposase